MGMIFKDPLLDAARILLALFIGVLCFAAVMLLICAPAVLIFDDQITTQLAAKGVVDAGSQFHWALALLLAAVAGLLALGAWFMLLLYRIVASVGQGEPFTLENSERLSHMGWIALGGQLAMLPVGGVMLWLASRVKDLPAANSLRFEADFGFDGGGILLVLILFILARVFRHGAAMREDLEGTV